MNNGIVAYQLFVNRRGALNNYGDNSTKTGVSSGTYAGQQVSLSIDCTDESGPIESMVQLNGLNLFDLHQIATLFLF